MYITHLKKSLLFLSLMLTLTLLSIPCFAKNIQLTLDGKPLQSTVAPIQENGTTLVPLRVISENLGAKVNYNAVNGEIIISKTNATMILTLGQSTVKVNGVTSKLQTAPKVINNTTMVPLRFISENLDCQVNWISQQNLIAITTQPENNNALPIATLKIKGYGTVTLELYPDLAPNTVNNFITLANSGFYDELIFHRVIEDFMIQGGDPNGNGTGGPGYSIAGEFSSNGFTTNTLSHTKGVISMARAMNPDSAGSQFFIMSSDGTYLDGQYAAFGKVISGLDIIEKIQLVDTNNQDKPLKDIVIESIRVSLGALKVTTPIKIEDK